MAVKFMHMFVVIAFKLFIFPKPWTPQVWYQGSTILSPGEVQGYWAGRLRLGWSGPPENYPSWNWSHNFQFGLRYMHWNPVKNLGWLWMKDFYLIDYCTMVVFWKWFIGVKWYNIICFDVCFLSLLLQHVATQNNLYKPWWRNIHPSPGNPEKLSCRSRLGMWHG